MKENRCLHCGCGTWDEYITVCEDCREYLSRTDDPGLQAIRLLALTEAGKKYKGHYGRLSWRAEGLLEEALAVGLPR